MDSWDRTFRLVVVAFLVTVTLVGGGAAQTDEPEPVPSWAAETEASLERIVDGHNAVAGDTVFGPGASLARDQRVTLTVTATDGSAAQFSFRTDAAARVVDFRAGPRDDATLRMFTDPATVDRIAAAPDRGAAFDAAVRAGDVRIEGVGPLNRAAVALLGLVLWALASPLQAVAVGTVAVVGVGGAVLAGTKLLGGGTVTAGSTGTTGGSTTVRSPVDPVGVADSVLSVFERALFLVALAKKLGGRLRRRLGSTAARLLDRFGFLGATEEQSESPTSERTDGPRARRRSPPRRRRR